MSDAKDLPIPTRQTPQSAGLDLHAKITETVKMKKGECVLIPVGIKIALPLGFEGQIRSRSGLALNHGVVVLNSPGTVDADYRGEIKVLLINHGEETFEIKRGDRIAQMVISKVETPELFEVDSIAEKLPDTKRDDGGFGSTGVSENTNVLRGGIDAAAFEEFKRKKAEEQKKIISGQEL
jgi:dUTP pyrophosphatase